MKTTLTVLVVLFLVALFYYRQRIYVRDPLATVYRNDVQAERRPSLHQLLQRTSCSSRNSARALPHPHPGLEQDAGNAA